jgi:hypothetical protein
MKNLKRIMTIIMVLLVFTFTLPAMSVYAADADMNYGRTKLNADQQYVYDALVSGCKDAKTDIKIKLTGKNINFSNDLGKILTMFYSDTPEYFWYSGSWSASYDGTTLTISPSYTMTGAALTSAKSAYNKKVSELTSGLGGKSDYEKSKILHDRLIHAVTYTTTTNDQNAYGALVEGKAVCNGYTRAYQHLMKEVGIPAWYVKGVSVNPATDTKIGHAWNLVKLDGKWYYTDVTWDDQGETIFYEYLNITTAKLTKGHTIDSEYASLVPQATSTNANYYKIEDRAFTTYDQAKLVHLLKKDNNKTQIYINGDVHTFLASVSSELLSIGEQLGGTGAFQVSCSTSPLDNAVVIKVVVISEGHTHKVKTAVKQENASCLSGGTKAHYICDCGLKFLDSACKKQVSSADELLIPAKKHSPSSWKNDVTSHWKECNDCGSETANTRGKHMDKNKDNKCDTCDYNLPVADESGNIVVSGGTETNNSNSSADNSPSGSTESVTPDKSDTPSTQEGDTLSESENTQGTDSESDISTESNDVTTDKKTDETGNHSSLIKWILVCGGSVVVTAGILFLIVLLRKKSSM